MKAGDLVKYTHDDSVGVIIDILSERQRPQGGGRDDSVLVLWQDAHIKYKVDRQAWCVSPRDIEVIRESR